MAAQLTPAEHLGIFVFLMTVNREPGCPRILAGLLTEAFPSKDFH